MSSGWEDDGLFAELDAYADWAMGPGRAYVRALDEPGWYVPLVVVLETGHTPDDFRRAVHATLGTSAGGLRCLCLPPWYRRTGGGDQPYRLSVLVTKAFFEAVALKSDLQDMISRIVIGQRLSPAAVNEEHQDGGSQAASSQGDEPAPDGDPEPGTVVMGVIDDAIAFAHERFRLGDGTTRVEYAWVQDLDGEPAHASTAVPYGREFAKTGIDALLQAHSRAGLVDEDGLYRAAGLVDFGRPGPKPAAWRIAHGTHVMDLACGGKPSEADASRPIVCVQLPAAVTADTSGAGLAPYVLDGIWYILDRADEIARDRGCGPLPVVINFSYGVLAGPHDGTHPIEQAIDAIVKERREKKAPTAVVVPSGNSHLARCHAEVAFEAKAGPAARAPQGEGGKDEGPAYEATLNWRILPDDRTSTFLEIWLPHTGTKPPASRVEVSVVPPGEPGAPPDGAGGDARWLGEDHRQARTWALNGDVVCKLSYEYVEESGRGRFLVAVAPTAFLERVNGARPALAPSGVWGVTLRNISLEPDQPVQLWIQRDDTPHGYPVRGRQSYFEDEKYKRFDAQGYLEEEDDGESFVRRAGSMSAIATGDQPVVIGGYVKKKGAPAPYSAGGPVTPKKGAGQLHRAGPDALAVSDDTEVHYGVLAAGRLSGSVVALNGTSVAAPQAARVIADDFAAPGGAGGLPVPGAFPGLPAVIGRARGAPVRIPAPIPDWHPPERVGAGPIAPASPPRRYWP